MFMTEKFIFCRFLQTQLLKLVMFEGYALKMTLQSRTMFELQEYNIRIIILLQCLDDMYVSIMERELQWL